MRSGTGTGRLTHLCIQNSMLFEGLNFAQCEPLQTLLKDPTLLPVVVFPGPTAVNLSRAAAGQSPEKEQFQKLFAPGLAALPEVPSLRSSRATLARSQRRPLVFVLDASWSCARTMANANPWLQCLPHISFTPQKESAYQFKTQPHKHCLSTLEAVFELLECFEKLAMFSSNPPQSHHQLLQLFGKMVEYQVGFSPGSAGHTQ